jgi:hypothetical protein
MISLKPYNEIRKKRHIKSTKTGKKEIKPSFWGYNMRS